MQPFPPTPFAGAGLYALYYRGALPLYAPLVADGRAPIYVGKAEAGNSRLGEEPDYDADKLWERIVKHSGSIREVESSNERPIRRDDFRVRYLPLDDAWIVLGERALLREYRPVLWSSIMDGFGSNPPGTGRSNGRSVWDTVHPGRARAGAWPNRKRTLDEMLSWVEQGIRVSLMPEGADRQAALIDLRSDKPPVIWSPAPNRDPDRRPLVGDERRFLAEVERLGLIIAPTEYRVVPQAALAREAGDAGGDTDDADIE